jgi:WD40 repeat protein
VVNEDGKVMECGAGQQPRELTGRVPPGLVAFRERTVVYRGSSGAGIGELDLVKGNRADAPVPAHFCQITAMATAASVSVTGGSDGSVIVWSGLDPIAVLFAHAAPITILAVSEVIGIVVSAVRDGAVVVAMLPGLVFLRRIEAGARHVVIVNNGGYIVTAGGAERNVLKVYGVNGEAIDQVVIDSPTLEMVAVSPKGGGDFVAVAGRDGRLAVYNVRTLEKVKVPLVLEKVVGVKWIDEMNALAVVTDTHAVKLLPFEMA